VIHWNVLFEPESLKTNNSFLTRGRFVTAGWLGDAGTMTLVLSKVNTRNQLSFWYSHYGRNFLTLSAELP